MILKWTVLALLSLVAKFLNYFLAPIVVPFASEQGWLPKKLSWFQTPDNSLDGDSGWKAEHWVWVKNRYIRRVLWLYRNSMYGFKIDVLGFQTTPIFAYEYKGNQEVSDNPYNPGWVWRTITNTDGKEAFQFYAVLPTTPTKCMRLMAGWKLWQSPRGDTRLQIAIVFTPFKKRG